MLFFIISEVTKLSVWVPDGDGACTNLLKFALNEQNFENTLVAFVVSMSTPWSILESLKKWSTILTDHIGKLNLSDAKREEFIKNQYRAFQLYQDPDEKDQSLANASAKKSKSKTETKPSSAEIDDSTLLPLDPSILTKNIGLPVIVIVTKVNFLNMT
jgi:dynein light intermediate chain 1